MDDMTYVTPECVPLLEKMYDAFNGIDIYNIYGKCWYWKGHPMFNGLSDEEKRSKLFGKKVLGGVEQEYQKFYTPYEYTPWVKRPTTGLGDDSDQYGIPDCIYVLPAAEQLNSDPVRQAFHIDNTQLWRMCPTVNSTFTYHKDARASQWAYEALKDTPIRMMHFSGNQDAAVPTIGTERWVNNLNWNVTKPWEKFMVDQPGLGNQVGGFVQRFDGEFTLIVVHGAGHMVPQDQRQRAYHILFNWIFKRGEFAEPTEEKPELLQQ